MMKSKSQTYKKTNGTKIIKLLLTRGTKTDIQCPALLETIILDKKEMLLISYQDTKGNTTITVKDKIKANGNILIPTSYDDLPYKPYKITREDLQDSINLEELYERVLHE